MSSGNERFNDEAAAWDSNPDVHRASDGAVQAILAAHPELERARSEGTAEKDGADVLEIGCGTGLLTFRLAPYVRSVVAVDAAEGMIGALRQKLEADPAAASRDKITPLCLMLEDPEDAALPPARGSDGDGDGDGGNAGPRIKFDLVTSHLVLHHIPDLASLLRTMLGCLKPGGRIALTDYEDFGPEARRFHPEAKMFGVERHGIRADWFAGLIREAGFVDVRVAPAWTMEKEVERVPGEWGQQKPDGDGVKLETMGFPFLLCQGTKPAA